MKNVDEALRIHIQQWDEDRKAPPKGTIAIPSAEKLHEIQAAFDKMAADGYDPFARPRGRPLAVNSSDERTQQSFQAFVFVNSQMRIFRKRNRIKRVPVKVRDVFIMISKQYYPKAVDEIVLEYIRENKKYVPW